MRKKNGRLSFLVTTFLRNMFSVNAVGCQMALRLGICQLSFQIKLGVLRIFVWYCFSEMTAWRRTSGGNTVLEPTKDCTSNSDQGPCEALMPRWYFNVTTETCEEFFYGGCRGNGNRYLTKEECQRTCHGEFDMV